MCGIAGFIDKEYSRENAEQLINQMCQVIRHRGPDDMGIWVHDGIALGMRRLSIIDVAGGHQPIFNEDHSILTVFNGEIYNYRELRQALQQRGHHFYTQSDTEVLVHAYEEFGDDCVKLFHGMFAFALWDSKHQRLLAARDRFGKKPLNYYWDGERLIFGSEIKSILEAGIPREVNPIALDEYLAYRYVPTPNTLFKHISKLPAAHILVYQDGQIRTQPYWELSFLPTCKDDLVTAIERCRALIKDAVQMRLISEVPLGAFLSGGIDSSTIVGLMSQIMSQPVKTFSIGFEEEDYNELLYARQVAQHFSTDHYEFLIRPDLVSVLPQLVWAYDEPFGDDSMLSAYYVSKLAREHVSVVLTGDGGDEIFAGYKHYQSEYAINRIPSFIRSLFGYGSIVLPEGTRGKERFDNLRRDPIMRWIRSTALFSDQPRSSIYTREYLAHGWDHNPYQRLTNQFLAAVQLGLDITACQQHLDVHTFLTDDILVKVDKASMFNSIETRAPMLDQSLAEYVCSLPSTIRMQNGTLKFLLKQVAADILPTSILRRPKQGFSTPIKHWLRGNLMSYAYDLLTSPRVEHRGIFDPQFIRYLLKTPLTAAPGERQSKAIWALLCLELWFQIYMDQPTAHLETETQIQVTKTPAEM
jgi:asparagine synthase (glutamine-hydrolysing)